jgi:Tol biopolymer transport system component/DNA-binding winged helix-turn-helix (wHTH) protein
MSEPVKPCYEFGSFRLDPAERSLRRDGAPVQLTPKMFDILLFMVERSGRLVSKDELMSAVWPDSFVEDANLTVNISSLRKALGESGNGHQYIETVQRRGYRFGVEVKKFGGSEAEMVEAEAPEQEQITRPRKGDGKGRKLALALGAVAVAIIVAVIHKFGASRWRQSESSFQTMKIAKLTTSGKVAEAIISPDGKYVAYVFEDGGKRSIRVKQVASESEVEIVAPSELPLGGMTFSRDGNFICFLKASKETMFPALYQIPVLGGMERKLLNSATADTRARTGISSSVTFSPDGARMAFLRVTDGPKESFLVVAEAGGSGDRTLAVRRWPESFAGAPAWSTDGKTIFCQTHSNINRYERGFVAISAADGAAREVGSNRWVPGEFAWLPDNAGLIFAAAEDAPGSISSNSQIWRLSFPGGEARRITNDLSNYGSVSLTADAGALVAVQRERLSSLWLVPGGDSTRARRITFSAGKREGLSGLATLPDGRIVYDVDTGVVGQRNIVVVNPDGGNPRQLTTNAQGRANFGQVVSPDGGFIIYGSFADRPHIWRMDSDGANARQLTFGDGELAPQISPDGRWIVYNAMNAGKPTIWKISLDGDASQLTFGGGEIDPQISPDGKWIVYFTMNTEKPTIWKMPFDGGAAIQLTNKYSGRPRISPDGKMIVCGYWDGWPNGAPKIAVIPFSGNGPVKTFDIDSRALQSVRWSPDGKALTYVDDRAGVSNLWSLPLDGSAPRQLTDFKSDRIYNYVWSRDGSQIICVRGVDVSDAVLISGFR